MGYKLEQLLRLKQMKAYETIFSAYLNVPSPG